MKREGLVTSTKKEEENSNPARRYCKPTEKSIQSLEDGKRLLEKTLEALEIKRGKELS
jgi:DNA-binding PadR family transcriptional regulator